MLSWLSLFQRGHPFGAKGVNLAWEILFLCCASLLCVYVRVCMYTRTLSIEKKVDRLIVYISLVIRVSTRVDFDMLFCIINSTVAGAYP